MRDSVRSGDAVETVPLFIGGKWVAAEAATEQRFADVHNPSTGEVIARTPLCGGAEVDAAVDAARAAFDGWARTPAPSRAEVLFRYRALLDGHAEEISRQITRENGKTLDEARGDIRRGIEVVEFACGIAHLARGESLPQIAPGIDGQTQREPIGVCAGITPFNFPAMVPLWIFPLALACGNAFVLKPSEKVPLTALRLGALLQEAGLPDGVFNIVHGGQEVVEALCTHPDIAAISFVGSSAIARRVYALGGEHGKRVQAAGGAKNVLLVMPDADPDPTLRAIVGSAFGCAGQRCMAGSLLMGIGAAGDALRTRVGEAAARLRVGDTSADDTAEMGPVIDARAQARAREAIGGAVRAGAAVVGDGSGGIPATGFFVAPTLLAGVTPEMAVFGDEVFGPVLSLLNPGSLEEAIRLMQRLPYGNGATIFTSSGHAARQFAREMPCGMIGVNVGVPAPMAPLPFTGWNGSFYGDLHVQGMEGVQFYTRQKVILSRWDGGYRRVQGW